MSHFKKVKKPPPSFSVPYLDGEHHHLSDRPSWTPGRLSSHHLSLILHVQTPSTVDSASQYSPKQCPPSLPLRVIWFPPSLVFTCSVTSPNSPLHTPVLWDRSCIHIACVPTHTLPTHLSLQPLLMGSPTYTTTSLACHPRVSLTS